MTYAVGGELRACADAPESSQRVAGSRATSCATCRRRTPLLIRTVSPWADTGRQRGVRNWSAFAKLGITAAHWFDGFGFFVNMRQPMRIDGAPVPLDPSQPAMLTFYVGFPQPGVPIDRQTSAARGTAVWHQLRGLRDADRRQLQQMFGSAGFNARRDIAGVVLNRWGHAYIAPQPGFYFGYARQSGAPRGHPRALWARSRLATASSPEDRAGAVPPRNRGARSTRYWRSSKDRPVSKDKAAWRHRNIDSASRPASAMNYFMLFVAIQICGAPFTPAFPIAAFSSGDAAKALAFSTLWKS